MIARSFVIAFSMLVMGVGLWVMVDPNGLVTFAEVFLTPSGLWVAVVIRLTVGALLWVTATASRTPIVLRVLGALFFVSGLALPFVGLERMLSIAAWGSGLDDWVLRCVGLLAATLGVFIIWSVLPRKSEG